MAETSADCNHIPNGLVDRIGRHVVRVDVAVAGANAVGDDHPFHRIGHGAVEQGTQHGGVTRAVIVLAHQRLDYAHGLDLVVVLTNYPFFATDIEPPKHV